MTYRLSYSPELCTSHYRGYTTSDLMYICRWYGINSSREIALALGRTQKSILNKVEKLKRSGEYDYYKNAAIWEVKLHVQIEKHIY